MRKELKDAKEVAAAAEAISGGVISDASDSRANSSGVSIHGPLSTGPSNASETKSKGSTDSLANRIRRLRDLFSLSFGLKSHTTSNELDPERPQDNLIQREDESHSGSPSSPSTAPSPLLRSYYDLRPYGLDMTIDFSWHRL